MKRQRVNAFAVLALGLTLCSGIALAASEPKHTEIRSAAPQSEVSFEDQTREIVGHAERLIARSDREGAVLDQKWYGFRRFGQYQELFLRAEKILFYGGLEADVQTHIRKPRSGRGSLVCGAPQWRQMG
jgi:hypothetical protein